MTKYNWTEIQQSYDEGNSFRDLTTLYGMSSKTLTLAARRGDLVTRNKSEAGKLCHSKYTYSHTDEFKQQQRERIIERYENGWMPKAGRCAKYTYTSDIAGTVSLDGTWELAVAKWLDEQGYTWKRNTKRFPYNNLKNKLSHYTPDFFVEGIGYIEVKGYETALDRCQSGLSGLPAKELWDESSTQGSNPCLSSRTQEHKNTRTCRECQMIAL